jgi:subtilisin family serine protease
MLADEGARSSYPWLFTLKSFSSPLQRLGLPVALAFAAGCSGVGSTSDDPVSAGSSAPTQSAPTQSAPTQSAPTATPELPDMSDRDRDRNRIDDAFARLNTPLTDIEVMLRRPTTPAQLASFEREGGHVRHVFVAVSYGWSGTVPRANLNALAASLGSSLYFIAQPRVVVPLLDEATRTGRVRPVWAPSFAGSSLGFTGNANITIGIIDTGFDATHTDLSGNSVGFKDYSMDAATVARDVQGHGTHVTAIAVGSGAAFGVGPGTLLFTNSGDLTGFASHSFLPNPIHTPAYFGLGGALQVSTNAVWSGGQDASLRAAQSTDPNGSWVQFGLVSGASPEAIASASTNGALARYSDALNQTDPASVTTFAVANSVQNYPAVGDGFNVMSGVAPRSNWFGAKVFSDGGIGDSADTAAAVDDLVALRVDKNIKLINMSLNATGGSDAGLRAKVNSAVDNGVLVVVAAGNGGPNATVGDPGRAKKALTVGATNDVNELTTYTSAGSATLDDTDSEDFKPDILAPGGSSYRSLILAADSNSADAESASFPDLQANDYRGLQGTSMAAPFAAGAAALVIDALQQSGAAWDFTSNSRPLLVKMLLLASATETATNREVASGGNPTLGRAQQPKDLYEGFGILNPDAAIEAATLALPSSFTGTVNNGAPYRFEWERRAWGRHVALHQGDTLSLALSMPQSADFDLYLYAGASDPNGDPVIRAASTSAILGSTDSISFTATIDETDYVIVKRVGGYGSFSLAAAHTVRCGNGVLDDGEQCDPAIAGSATCCDDHCQALAPSSPCDDGDACTATDRCSAGKCVGGDAIKCPYIECTVSGGCNPDTGKCEITSVFNDGAACSLGTCRAGQCIPDSLPVADAGSSTATDGGAAGAVNYISRSGRAAEGGAAGNPSSAAESAGSAADEAASRAGTLGEVSATGGGASHSGGLDTVTDPQGGCGCFVVGSGRRAGSALSIASLLLGLFASRRRRVSSCQSDPRP